MPLPLADGPAVVQRMTGCGARRCHGVSTQSCPPWPSVPKQQINNSPPSGCRLRILRQKTMMMTTTMMMTMTTMMMTTMMMSLLARITQFEAQDYCLKQTNPGEKVKTSEPPHIPVVR